MGTDGTVSKILKHTKTQRAQSNKVIIRVKVERKSYIYAKWSHYTSINSL